MMIAPEFTSSGGECFDGFTSDRGETVLSRISSEHFLPGSFSFHAHLGGKDVQLPGHLLVPGGPRVRYPRYEPVSEFSARSWAGILAARYAKLAEEKQGVCGGSPSAVGRL